MKNSVFLGSCAAVLLATACLAEGENHDVTTYDVAGIKVGMGLEEAMTVLVDGLGIDRDTIRTGIPKPNPVTEQKEMFYFTAETDDFEVFVGLTAAIPPSAEVPLVVSQVTFTMPATPDNTAAMKARAIEKYGTPTKGSADEPPHFDVSWCTIPAENPNASCAAVPGARITLTGGMNGRELKLFDPSYSNAVAEYLNGKNSSAPKF